MHEFMMYNQELLRLNHKAYHQTRLTATKANDFLVHILRHTSLTELSNEYRACREGCLSRNAIQNRIIELLRVKKLPESCSAISGLLAFVTVDFFEQFIYAVPVKEQVMKINMKLDETNSLKELQQYMFHIFIQ